MSFDERPHPSERSPPCPLGKAGWGHSEVGPIAAATRRVLSSSVCGGRSAGMGDGRYLMPRDAETRILASGAARVRV